MREEITEPQHWRTNSERHTRRNKSWTSQRSQKRSDLAAEAVDAALTEAATEEPATAEPLDSSEIISSLATQLELLEKQREQIQRLLDQAQGS